MEYIEYISRKTHPNFYILSNSGYCRMIVYIYMHINIYCETHYMHEYIEYTMCMYAKIYIYIHTYIHTYIHIHTYTYIHIHTHTYIHTSTHIYIHIYIYCR